MPCIALPAPLPAGSLAWGHADSLAGPDGSRLAWTWDPLVLLNLGLLAWLYLRGLGLLWHSAGVGRGPGVGQAWAFLGALFTLVAALLSSLAGLGEGPAAYVARHPLLMLAAPLFVLGVPALVLARGLPGAWRPVLEGWRGRLGLDLWGRVLSRPLPVWLLYTLVLWVWHLPVLYRAALNDPLAHDVRHLTFFLAGWLFWRVVLDPISGHRLHPTMAVLFLFTASLHASVLGVFLTLSPRVWYGAYADGTEAWGLTPLEDQQLVGLIMWVPACLIYPAVAAALLGVWLASQCGPVHRGRQGREPGGQVQVMGAEDDKQQGML